MSIATPAFFWSLFAWKIFFQPFTFSLYNCIHWYHAFKINTLMLLNSSVLKQLQCSFLNMNQSFNPIDYILSPNKNTSNVTFSGANYFHKYVMKISTKFYLQCSSFHHNFLSGRLDSSQCKKLSLEHHRRFISIQFYTFKFLLSPFHSNCKQTIILFSFTK